MPRRARDRHLARRPRRATTELDALLLAGGELTWAAGPLRKGPGLCHGTAGNGFAFLKLFARTGDERWLGRARRFAMHAAAQVEAERAGTGHGRHALWTGDLGTAIFLHQCLAGGFRPAGYRAVVTVPGRRPAARDHSYVSTRRPCLRWRERSTPSRT